MRRSDLIECIHIGIRDACRDYGEWSGGESIHERGIESLMVSSVARAMATGWKESNKNAYLSLETSFAEIALNSRTPPRPGRKPSILVGAPRADLVLWNANAEVRSVIEVKRKWVPNTCNRDIERLIALIERYGPQQGGTVGTGFLVTMVVVPNGGLETRLKTIRSSVKELANEAVTVRVHHGATEAYLDAEEKRAGYSVVIELVSKKLAADSI